MNKISSRIVEYPGQPQHTDVLYYIDGELKSVTVRCMFKNGVVFTFDLYIDDNEVLLRDVLYNNGVSVASEVILNSNIDDLEWNSLSDFICSKQFKDILYIYFKHIKTKYITILIPKDYDSNRYIALEGIEDDGSVK